MLGIGNEGRAAPGMKVSEAGLEISCERASMPPTRPFSGRFWGSGWRGPVRICPGLSADGAGRAGIAVPRDNGCVRGGRGIAGALGGAGMAGAGPLNKPGPGVTEAGAPAGQVPAEGIPADRGGLSGWTGRGAGAFSSLSRPGASVAEASRAGEAVSTETVEEGVTGCIFT